MLHVRVLNVLLVILPHPNVWERCELSGRLSPLRKGFLPVRMNVGRKTAPLRPKRLLVHCQLLDEFRNPSMHLAEVRQRVTDSLDQASNHQARAQDLVEGRGGTAGTSYTQAEGARAGNSRDIDYSVGDTCITLRL